jgi:hypothetical protein
MCASYSVQAVTLLGMSLLAISGLGSTLSGYPSSASALLLVAVGCSVVESPSTELDVSEVAVSRELKNPVVSRFDFPLVDSGDFVFGVSG